MAHPRQTRLLGRRCPAVGMIYILLGIYRYPILDDGLKLPHFSVVKNQAQEDAFHYVMTSLAPASRQGSLTALGQCKLSAYFNTIQNSPPKVPKFTRPRIVKSSHCDVAQYRHIDIKAFAGTWSAISGPAYQPIIRALAARDVARHVPAIRAAQGRPGHPRRGYMKLAPHGHPGVMSNLLAPNPRRG